MGKDLSRQLNADTDIDTVGFGRDLQVMADGSHPFGTASSAGNNADGRFVCFIFCMNEVAVLCLFDFFSRSVKMDIDLVFQFSINILQDDIVFVRSQMADGGIQQVQSVLNADFFEFGIGVVYNLVPSPP